MKVLTCENHKVIKKIEKGKEHIKQVMAEGHTPQCVLLLTSYPTESDVKKYKCSVKKEGE